MSPRLAFLGGRERVPAVRYVRATGNWRKRFRWLRVRFRPHLSDYREINAAWVRVLGLNRHRPAVLNAIRAQWKARDFETQSWNSMRFRDWCERVRTYPHGIAESYIGGPLVIP